MFPLNSSSPLTIVQLECPTFESITTLHRQVPNYTLSFGAVTVLVQGIFVCASIGFSNPDILETRIFPERT